MTKQFHRKYGICRFNITLYHFKSHSFFLRFFHFIRSLFFLLFTDWYEHADWLYLRWNNMKAKKGILCLKDGSFSIDTYVKPNRCDIDYMTLSHFSAVMVIVVVVVIGCCLEIELGSSPEKEKWKDLNMTLGMNILWSENFVPITATQCLFKAKIAEKFEYRKNNLTDRG